MPMKFINTSTLELVHFYDEPSSQYAVFSCSSSSTTAAAAEPPGEVTPRHDNRVSALTIQEAALPDRHSIRINPRVLRACHQARAQDILYLWAAELCIDHSSTADTAEAVTASFRLVWNAALCIALLPDLTPETNSSIFSLTRDLSGCRWFKEAWALQDLVASRRIEFYDRDWNLRLWKDKDSTSPVPCLQILSLVSGVEATVLADRDAVHDVSLGRRLSWAAGRTSTRPEDVAYALAGICGIGGQLAPRYGEGGRLAFLRLQMKILRGTTDLSILAWARGDGRDIDDAARQEEQTSLSGVLADSPSDFRHFASRPHWDSPFTSQSEVTFSNRGLRIPGLVSPANHHLGHPSCGAEIVLFLGSPIYTQWGQEHVGISLKQVGARVFARTSPGTIVCRPAGVVDAVSSRVCVVWDIDNHEMRRISQFKQERESATRRYMNPVVGEPGSISISQQSFTGTDFIFPGSVDMQEQPIFGEGMVTDIFRTPPSNVPRSLDLLSGLDDSGLRNLPADDDLDPENQASESDSEGSISSSFNSSTGMQEELPDGHFLQPILPDLVMLALEAWEDEKAGVASQKQSPVSEPETYTASPAASETASIPFRPRMRARLDDNSEGGQVREQHTAETDSDEQDTLVVRPKRRTKRAKHDVLAFACPFYKLDPARHRGCTWGAELSDAHAVIQHVIDHHRRPAYCPVCYDVFEKGADRDKHIVARGCSKREAPSGLLVGVSEDQKRSLARRDGGKVSRAKGGVTSETRRRMAARAPREEAKWFRIWQLLFPDVPLPGSAFLSAPREKEAVAMRRFWFREGHRLIAGMLRRRGVVGGNMGLDGTVWRAMHASVLKGMAMAEECG